jgi:hypothetical protein
MYFYLQIFYEYIVKHQMLYNVSSRTDLHLPATFIVRLSNILLR